jgi:hypothetical protein
MNSAFFASFGTQYCRHIYESFNGSLSDKSRKKLASSLHATISCAASTLQENKVGFGDTDNGTAPVLTLNIQLM